jgi:hypothetical protein
MRDDDDWWLFILLHLDSDVNWIYFFCLPRGLYTFFFIKEEDKLQLIL